MLCKVLLDAVKEMLFYEENETTVIAIRNTRGV